MGALPILILSILLTQAQALEKKELIVFHAGSLSVPFEKMEREFEKEHPEIDVRRESSGSVMAIRKVVELKKPCDCVASADYRLIPKMMFPEYAKEVRIFATNELVLCYTERSKFAKEINRKNWFEVLRREGVKWGFSNPNLDPCGYRTLMALVLSSEYYGKPSILELLKESSPVKVEKRGGGYLVTVPENFKPKSKNLVVRPKAVSLLGLLESGAIDYAFEYRSVALQHNLKFVELPPQVNLSELKYEKLYRRVKVKLGNGKVIEGGTIAYGIAAVNGAPHPKEARMWVDFVTSPKGAEILKSSFQKPIQPPQVVRYGEK